LNRIHFLPFVAERVERAGCGSDEKASEPIDGRSEPDHNLEGGEV
jgi:hypothetical protein